jgi:mRNA interferase RelE/StbE
MNHDWKVLQGNLQDKWRYRVGDYRILAKIENAVVVMTIVEVGHRRDHYEFKDRRRSEVF